MFRYRPGSIPAPFPLSEYANPNQHSEHVPSMVRKYMNTNNFKLSRFRSTLTCFAHSTSEISAATMATSNLKASAVLPVDSFSFALLSSSNPPSAEDETSPRLGEVHFPRRMPMSTPHYISLTSRGAVPHLTQDMMRDHTSISGVYAALEDCMLLNVSIQLIPHSKPRV